MSDARDVYAFPQPMISDQYGLQVTNSSAYGSGGMTLRDYFAGQALAGLCAAMGPDWSPSRLVRENEVADDAFALADAMLAKRDRLEEQ